MGIAGHVVLMLVIGYLLGSLPFARLFTMRSGVDLFSTGTGNPGAANVFRKVSKRLGTVVFIADGLKGAVPVAIAWAVGTPEELWVIGGAAAIVGHWYPVFNGFRGGAGLATGAGLVIALMPLAGLIGLIIGMTSIFKFKSSAHGAFLGLGIIVVLWIPFGFMFEWPWPIGSVWTAPVGAMVISAILFGKAARKGWKPGRKE